MEVFSGHPYLASNGMDPDQDQYFDEPGLGPNCLLRCQHYSNPSVKSLLFVWIHHHVMTDIFSFLDIKMYPGRFCEKNSIS